MSSIVLPHATPCHSLPSGSPLGTSCLPVLPLDNFSLEGASLELYCSWSHKMNKWFYTMRARSWVLYVLHEAFIMNIHIPHRRYPLYLSLHITQPITKINNYNIISQEILNDPVMDVRYLLQRKTFNKDQPSLRPENTNDPACSVFISIKLTTFNKDQPIQIIK